MANWIVIRSNSSDADWNDSRDQLLTPLLFRRKLQEIRKSSMRQKGRGEMLQGLLIGLLTLVAAATAHAQITPIDFQVIHLPRTPAAAEQYVAIRSQEAWAALWPDSSRDPKTRPIPNIDFEHFILLIANTGVKPSSGYSNVFTSVDTLPASMTGAPPSTKPVTSVHIVEIGPGSCPRLTAFMGSVSYALIPQTTNEIRFVVTRPTAIAPAP